MIWLVRFVNLTLIIVLLLFAIGLLVGPADSSWCMFPDVSVVRPLPCDWAIGFYRA